MVVVDHDHFEELFQAPTTDLHFMMATLEDFDFPCVFQANILEPAHTNAIRFNLTQNIPALTPEIVDELRSAIDDEFESILTKGNPFQ